MSTILLHNERDLLWQVAEGDAVAFGKIYQHYYVQLRPVFMNYTRNAEETEEILQQAFINVWLHRDRLPSVENFRSWLFTIATRVYLKSVRKRVVYQQKLAGLANEGQGPGPATPLEATAVQEIKRLIEEAVQLLPAQRRRIYELSRKDGLRIEEIARTLDITPRTVKNTISLALQSIRDHLEQAGHGSLIAVYLCLQLL